MGAKIFIDGMLVENEDARISVFDHGLLYGDGVFEGIRSYNRKVFRLSEHIDRLFSGAEVIQLKIPMTADEMNGKIIETLRVNDLDDAYIRVIVTRGVGDLGLDPGKCPKATVIIITDKIVLYPEDFYEKGLPVVTAKTRRNHPLALNPRVKSLNYLNNIMGKLDAIDAGTQEAIMLSIDGHVVECTGDNIFAVKGDELWTPPWELGSLEGITQKVVIELAEEKDIKTKYKKMSMDDLYTADECFLTGTAAEVIPVIKIDEKVIGGGTPGRVTLGLLNDFKRFTGRNGVPY